jgi:succinate dehydrogenase flavin-adding protein (antitoxin of CptAB toxin-antitoxin module)
MKIIITEEQLKLLIESDLKSYIKGVEYIPGENVEYSTIRRIGKYLVDKNLIEDLLSKSMKHFLKGHGRSFIDCEESKYDVILDTTDAILYYYEDSWDEDEQGAFQEELADVFDQIREFLDDMYGNKIEDYCGTIEL